MSWGTVREAAIWIVSGATTIVGYLLLAKDMATLQIPTYALIAFGNILLLLIFLRAFARQRQEMLADFYALNRQARLERAYRIAYHLHFRGLREIHGDVEIRKRWDRDVRQFLSDSVGPDALEYYCQRTGRMLLGSQDRALSEEEMKDAMRVIEGFLDTDFEHYFQK